MALKSLLFVYLLIFIIGSEPKKLLNFSISDIKILLELPSASGICKHQGFYYAIGDDSQYLFKLNKEFEVVEKYTIHLPAELLENGRIPKSVKPDFEGLEMISDSVFMVIGSGSRSPQRDQLIIVDAYGGFVARRYQLTEFYSALQDMPIMQGSELNIEAIAYADRRLYLFNRRKNIIFKVHYDQFLEYLKTGQSLPNVEAEAYELPMINGVEAGFSGATNYEEANALLLTASVEDTNNAYDDGKVLGSFIGTMSLDFSRKQIQWNLISSNGSPLKIESVTIDEVLESRDLQITLVADNDDGNSIFVRGKLSW